MWIRNNQESNHLKVLRFGLENFINMLEVSVENGDSVLIENVSESFDSMLSRNIVKRSTRKLVQIGDREFEFNVKLKLFLQTKL
jgi:dynein heavy chain